MFDVFRSAAFHDWLTELRDIRARARIEARISRLSMGNAGAVKAVAAGVCEMRVHYGPGYRVYFTRRGRDLTLLWCGGDKRTQDKDIELAKEIAQEWDESAWHARK